MCVCPQDLKLEILYFHCMASGFGRGMRRYQNLRGLGFVGLVGPRCKRAEQKPIRGFTESKSTGRIHKSSERRALSPVTKEFRKIRERTVRVHYHIRTVRNSHSENKTWLLRDGERRRKVRERVAKQEFVATFSHSYTSIFIPICW